VQINVPPIPSFPVPGSAGTVAGITGVGQAKPVREEGDQTGEPAGGGAGAGGGQQGEAQTPQPQVDRRDVERRSGQDRRRQQIPVLLDTRVGERRKTQRREEDPPPPAVDFRV